MMAAISSSKPRREADDTPVRQRILDAAFSAFMESGFAETSTLEIATRARVSKRELYALVGSKQEMLMACIGERAKRLQVPTDLPELHDRESLARVLATFGTQLLRDLLAAIAGFTGRRAPRISLPRMPLYPLAFGAEAVARLTGKEPLLTLDGLRMSRYRMFFTSAKAERELGYRSRPYQEGVADALAWFRKAGYLT